ncbi:hypothetical protein LTR65_004496 [Meristemomyces frigidus]
MPFSPQTTGPSHLHNTTNRAGNMPLIPQNTLAGLPNELIGMVMADTMAKPTPIDVNNFVEGKPRGLAAERYRALKPFKGNSILHDIAKREYYENNTFLTSIATIDGDLRRRFLLDDPGQRESI